MLVYNVSEEEDSQSFSFSLFLSLSFFLSRIDNRFDIVRAEKHNEQVEIFSSSTCRGDLEDSIKMLAHTPACA